MVADVNNFDVVSEGRSIREGLYGKEGSNVNFVSRIDDNTYQVRTYERGVEDETLSCGTGVTAVAIAMNATETTTSDTIKLVTPGGDLEVSFIKNKGRYEEVRLKGPVVMVFKGVWP